MCRRLSEVLFRIKFLFCQHRIHTQISYKHIALFFFFVGLCVYRAETVKQQLGCRHSKAVFIRADLHRSRLVSRRIHAACSKTFPDQLIQPELVSRQRVFQRCRRPCYICRTDCLVRILYFLAAVRSLLPWRRILFSII